MKLVKVTFGVFATLALVFSSAAAVSFAGTTHTFTYTSNDTSLGTVAAQENSPNLSAFNSPGQVDDGAVVIVGAFPTAIGRFVAFSASGGCGSASEYGPETEQYGPVTANCTVLVTFASNAPVIPSPPTVSASSATVTENTSSNDIPLTLGGGTADYVTVSTNASHGSASASGTSISYTPAAGYTGPDSFQFTATNGGGTSTPATVSLTVNPPKPVTGSISLTVDENSSGNPVTLALSGGTPTSVAIVDAASHGTAALSDKSISYTPTPNYYGSDSFTYSAMNAGGTSSKGTVSITVNPPVPTVGAVSATVTENTSGNAITLDLGTGPVDHVTISTAASHGTASASGSSISYTPAANYVGPDTFQYTATNGGGTSSMALVSITVNPPAPIAGAVSLTVEANSSENPVTLELSGGPAESVAVVDAATNGTASASGASITYSPTPGYFGPDSFTYTATNAGGTSTKATVTVTVNPPPPVASDVTVTVDENSSGNPITLDLTGGAPTNVSVVDDAGHGTAVSDGSTITYTPSTNYAGPDEFTYTAQNAGGTAMKATVYVTVAPVYATITADFGDAFGNTTATDGSALAMLTVTDTTTNTVIPYGGQVQEGDDVQVTWSLASGYTVDTYTAPDCVGAPTDIPNGVDLGAIGSDGSTCAFYLSISATSAPSVAATAATVASNAGATSIPLLLSGQAATSIAAGNGAHGTVTVSGETALYTPDAGYSGPDSFTYTATNDAGTSSSATVTVTVTPPVITLSKTSVDAGGTLDINGTGFASNESVTVVLHSRPVTLGTFQANVAGELSATVTIPLGTAAGSHTIMAEGAVSGTTSAPLTVDVTAVTKILSYTGGLTSGGIATDLFLAGLLAALGSYLVLSTRRRQRREILLD